MKPARYITLRSHSKPSFRSSLPSTPDAFRSWKYFSSGFQLWYYSHTRRPYRTCYRSGANVSVPCLLQSGLVGNTKQTAAQFTNSRVLHQKVVVAELTKKFPASRRFRRPITVSTNQPPKLTLKIAYVLCTCWRAWRLKSQGSLIVTSRFFYSPF
jgi:hypothetical protein